MDAPDGYRDDEWGDDLGDDNFGKDSPRRQQRFPFANRPRENVTWAEAVAFCRWLTEKARSHPELLPDDEARKVLAQGGSIRLPTVQEWVKAARGFDDRLYPWGGQEYRGGFANVDETKDNNGPHNLQETSPVGMYPHAASPFGVEEMSGNVWEYCLNHYYKSRLLSEIDTDFSAVRGESWILDSVRSPVAARGIDVDYFNNIRGGSNFGFRVVFGPSPYVPLRVRRFSSRWSKSATRSASGSSNAA